MTGIATTDPQLTREEFVMIRDFIHEKCGIFFPENKMYLVTNRLVRRMAELGIKSYRDYFYQVKYDASLVEFNQLMNLITTNETSFFRNEPQLLSFSDEVLPLLIQQKSHDKGTKTLRIWSAGCSTGEEPYTLAAIILERLKSLAGWNVEIIANDISEAVLQKARLGEYSGITLRNMKPDILNKYFTKNGENYRVNKELRALVKFSHLNLNDPVKITMNANFDVVFCRNVMIYFSEEVKIGLVRNFYNSLRPGGYFYIGHSETLHGVSKAFKLVYFKNALVYHKEVVGAPSASMPNALTPIRSAVASGPSMANSGAGSTRALDLLSKIKPVAVKK
jgi:chemotaxis protein methyltransferase CheR